jgi:uroporphyrinogen-III synthase/uroporphyrinogen III methyltransferase/synthase
MKGADKTVMPLAGRRILVTRAAHQAGKLSDALRALGAEPVEVPVFEIRPPANFAPLDRALLSLDSYDWLILTSANTVSLLAERSAALGLHLTASDRMKVAAVGEATAASARNAGLLVAVVPESYVGESLIEEILRSAQSTPAPAPAEQEKAATAPSFVSGHEFTRAEKADRRLGASAPEGSLLGLRFLIARAAIARDVIPDALRSAGAIVDVVDAYQNVMPETAPELLREALRKGIVAATFTSSSSVTHLAEAARAARIAFPFAGVAAISIGPITSATLRDHGWEPAAEANPHDVPGLVAAVANLPTR